MSAQVNTGKGLGAWLLRHNADFQMQVSQLESLITIMQFLERIDVRLAALEREAVSTHSERTA